MSLPRDGANGAKPEILVTHLAARLRSHGLWDRLLVVAPLTLAALFIAYCAHGGALISPLAFGLTALVAVGLALAAVLWRYRRGAPSMPAAARLIDRQAESQDRFLTLATLPESPQAAQLLARLRQESAALGERVELGRDFPYKVKNSFYRSLAASLAAALLLYFSIPAVQSRLRPMSVAEKLRQVAEQMAQKESLKTLAQELKQLAAKLDDPKATPEEKQAAKESLEDKIAEQQKQEKEPQSRDLLSQAANSLAGAEQQQAASGQEQKKDQDQGGGGLQSNLPQDGKGESKQSEGGSGDSKGEQQSAQMSNEMKQGKSAQGNPKEKGDEKNQQGQGDAKGDERDSKQPGKEPSNEKAGKNQGGGKDGAGKNQASEEPPQGAPPAERFYKAGEGKEGIKGARYVTVQLPEDVAADSKADGKATKEGGGASRRRAQLPVSNAPLPAHVPNAPAEKQQMPIEYRGIIR